MNEQELKILARQLSHPSGQKGIEMGDMMNETNINMTLHAIHHLDIVSGDRILELGHGNCKHLPEVFSKNNATIYTGLERSELMHAEALDYNASYVADGKAYFHLFDGDEIPYEADSFEKIFTVNTVYFWEKPTEFLAELLRVLKRGGLLNITFAHKSFMEKLPFTAFGFQLYELDDMIRLIKNSTFNNFDIKSDKEFVKSKTGELVERTFSTIILRKD